VEKSPDAFRTISEVAEDLDLPQHVLRFWESRFGQIKPLKRAGGRRYYRPDDVALLRGIRHLLYGEGYTIRGVQRILKERGSRFVQAVWQVGAPQPERETFEVPEAAAGDVSPQLNAGRADRERGSRSQGERDSTDKPERSNASGKRRQDTAVRGAEPRSVPEPASVRLTSDAAEATRSIPGSAESDPDQAHATVDAAEPRPTLGPADLNRLQGVLDELCACRELIERVLTES
jgi:DNA-binding transcriptional MerR regulator